MPAAMRDALDEVAKRQGKRRTDVVRRYILEGLMRDSEEEDDGQRT
jgi:metal-responsive CopG/Arc/MetJ family transcriptional regulator